MTVFCTTALIPSAGIDNYLKSPRFNCAVTQSDFKKTLYPRTTYSFYYHFFSLGDPNSVSFVIVPFFESDETSRKYAQTQYILRVVSRSSALGSSTFLTREHFVMKRAYFKCLPYQTLPLSLLRTWREYQAGARYAFTLSPHRKYLLVALFCRMINN